jgi:ABC-type Fe3+-hydroxamate transport system substrate-binding protein
MAGPGTRDDLGHPFRLAAPARRVVSLVPSLTESVAATRPEALAGATIWCSRPAGLDVPRVRGTKNPDLSAIAALEPDIVLANQEENRRVDVERLRAAGIPVWVTVIRTLDEAFASLCRVFADALGWPDEPHAFSPVDGPEMFPGLRVALVEGRSLTWYGPSLVTARAVLLEQLAK